MSLALEYQDAYKNIVRLQAGKLKGQAATEVKDSLLKIFSKIDDTAKEGREAINRQESQGRGLIEDNAKNDGIAYPQDVLDDAKFALAALADESASKSLLKDQWKAAPKTTLVLTLFPETGNAGNEFYARLERIAQTGGKYSAELLEVYCLCLLLGYMGVYSGKKLADTTKKTLERIERALGRAPDLLVGESHLKEVPAREHNRLWWVPIAGVAAAVLYALFWGYLDYRDNQLTDLVRAYLM